MSNNLTIKNIPNPMLSFDIALNIMNKISGKPEAWSDEDFLAIYGYSASEVESFKQSEDFQKSVHIAIQELKESGGSIKQKSRLSLEHYLDVAIPQMMAEGVDVVPAKDKIAILQFLAKLGGMVDESKSKEQQSANNAQSGPTFTLVLTTPTPVEPSYAIIQQEPSK